MNEHAFTIHGTSSSKKTGGWMYIHYWFMQAVASNLIHKAGYKRVGLTFLADATKFNHELRMTKLFLRDSAEVTKDGNDYKPKEDATTYASEYVINYPEASYKSGTFYLDIPDDVEEFYIVFQTVNVDFYIEEIWLE